jgi:hypothetical protein
MHDVLARAIEKREVLSVLYGGGRRLIEPFTLGYGSKGQTLLRAYQVSGFSRSGVPSGWKLFSVSELTSFSPTGSKYVGPRPGYNPNDSVMKGGIIAAF